MKLRTLIKIDTQLYILRDGVHADEVIKLLDGLTKITDITYNQKERIVGDAAVMEFLIVDEKSIKFPEPAPEPAPDTAPDTAPEF
jgi:hypothetical protein